MNYEEQEMSQFQEWLESKILYVIVFYIGLISGILLERWLS